MPAKDTKLFEYINKTKQDLDRAMRNYDYCIDPSLIDYYSYIIKANEVKLKYLLKQNENA